MDSRFMTHSKGSRADFLSGRTAGSMYAPYSEIVKAGHACSYPYYRIDKVVLRTLPFPITFHAHQNHESLFPSRESRMASTRSPCLGLMASTGASLQNLICG